MEKIKLTNSSIVPTNMSKSLILKQNYPKIFKKSNSIKHYELIKDMKKEKINNVYKKGMSNTLYLNNSKIKQKLKNIFYSPRKRLNSTIINPEKIFKNLNFVILSNDEISDIRTKKIIKKNYKKLNAYYYSANIPIKNKYIVDSLNQDKPRTNQKIKKNKVSIIQQKIDTLAKNLNLFQYKHKNNNLKIVQNPFAKKIDKISNRETVQSYYSRQNENRNNTKSTLPTKFLQSYMDKTNASNNNIKIREYTDKKEVNKEEDEKEDKTNSNSKNILEIIQKTKERKNEQISAKFLDGKDEFLYKKIFLYNNINQKKRSPSIIDNKLNIFYCENISQYNQKMNKINDMLVKKGKPMIHQGVERNSKGNMERIIKKIQFMKKIVDYVYPNMVLYKVKQENKRASNTKSLDFKLSRSHINLLNLKEERKKIDSYFGSSLSINNH